MDCKDWQLICCYTRQKALDDGVLVDVSDFVSDFGFIVPVAVTATLFNGYILPSAKLVEAGQTSESRMIDLLVILLLKIIARPHTDRITFNVSFDIDAHEYQGRYFNQIRAWNVTKVSQQAMASSANAAGVANPTNQQNLFPPEQQSAQQQAQQRGNSDDLPF